jgi:CheY-like chemotaxis protein
VINADIELPESDGYQLIREIRARESVGASRQIPAIALMPFARSEDRMRALGAGYQMHLSKPVEPAELVTVLASLAGRIGT